MSTIVVVGAAGSIGSAVVKKLIAERGYGKDPGKVLIAVDRAETPMFYFLKELEEAGVGTVRPMVCSAVMAADILRAEKTDVDVLIYAGASKHVALCERNVIAAVANNFQEPIFTAATLDPVRTVYISTDKAASPTTIMGATKRLCELGLADTTNLRGDVVSLRFVNVQSSNGSVHEVFNRRAAAGLPLIVRGGKDTQRQFITAADAANLILDVAFGSFGDGATLIPRGLPPAIRIWDVAQAVAAAWEVADNPRSEVIGVPLDPWEKYIEALMSSKEMDHATPLGDYLVIDNRGQMSLSVATEIYSAIKINSERKVREALMRFMKEVL